MTHKRQIIRETIAAILGQIPSLAGRVLSTRTRPTEAAELPVAIVYTLSELAEPATIGGDLRRTLTGIIEIRASSAGRIDDELDGFAELVEAKMAEYRNLGGAAVQSWLANTVIGLDGEGESRQAVASLSYTILYDTDPSGI